MKIAIIGGAGARTPLLVRGLSSSDLPVREIALYDVAQDRLPAIAALARELHSLDVVSGFSRTSGVASGLSRTSRDRDRVRITACATPEECVAGADFVFTTVRVGGIHRRARDEAVAIAHGVLGQETVGPAGLAMALRSIPVMVGYGRLVERIAPEAWIVNFTNPVGIVTQAVATETRARIIGICDTPMELFERVAHVLALPFERCLFDYFGLNHLGWLREADADGRPQLSRLWDRPDLLSRVYRAPIFDVERLREIRLLPTEYVFFYDEPQRALRNLQRAGETRGGVVARLNAQLYEALRRPDADRQRIYEEYLRQRDGGYMQLETGASPIPDPKSPRSTLRRGSPELAALDPQAASEGGQLPNPESRLGGYDRIALAVVRAISHDSGRIIPLNVSNRGNLPSLADEDIVEIPCTVTANGPLPLHVGRVPPNVEPLLVRVKEYERLAVGAGLARSRDLAIAALAHHPLVDDRGLATRLIDALDPWQTLGGSLDPP